MKLLNSLREVSRTVLDRVITMLWFLLVIVLVVLWLIGRVENKRDWSYDVNTLVKAMYEFDSPRSLMEQQEVAKSLLEDEAEWGRLSLENESRTINTYYKFGYRASKVHVVQRFLWNEEHSACIIYWLENENISDSKHWMLLADRGEDGKLKNIRDYQLIWETGSEQISEFKLNH